MSSGRAPLPCGTTVSLLPPTAAAVAAAAPTPATAAGAMTVAAGRSTAGLSVGFGVGSSTWAGAGGARTTLFMLPAESVWDDDDERQDP